LSKDIKYTPIDNKIMGPMTVLKYKTKSEETNRKNNSNLLNRGISETRRRPGIVDKIRG